MTTEYRGKVRDRDPETSWAAASLQTETKTARLQVEIYELLREVGPLTHDEIRAELLQRAVAVSPSGARTRVKELQLAGWVTAADKLGQSDLGHPATRWRAVTEDEPAPERRPAPKSPAPEFTAVHVQDTPEHAEGLAAARARAEWELGNPEVAEMIVRAYLDPETDAAALAGERA